MRLLKALVKRAIPSRWHPPLRRLLGKRASPRESLERCAQLFNERNGKVIVEIGTGLHGEMSGNSILVWYTKTSAERIFAVDVDERRIREVREHTRGSANVTAVLSDGVKFLREFQGTIDLLYLDFWAATGQARAEQYLAAYLAVKDKLDPSSMILIDDTDMPHPWKHTLIVPEAMKDGFEIKWIGRQTLLARSADIGR